MTAGRSVHSQSVHWCTPYKYIKAVKKVFGGVIDLDPCSNKWSIVGAKKELIPPEHNGLIEDWNYRTIYVNPPYGADRSCGTTIKHWLYKCAHANRNFNSEVLALAPVASNTGHWKEYVWGKAVAVCFLYETRLKFLENGDQTGKGAPMSCAMIYWGRHYKIFFDVFLKFGAVLDLRGIMGRTIGEEVVAGKKKKLKNDLFNPFSEGDQLNLL